MAKQGMKRPEIRETPKNEAVVPQLQGSAKTGKEKAKPIISGTSGAQQKVWHTDHPYKDNDLARDNLENDIPYADLQDLP